MNNEPMSDERLAELRGYVDGARQRELRTNSTGHPTWHEALAEALLEIERLRSERDTVRRGAATLGRVVEAQCRDALNATGLHHLIDETGDGDWGAVWENLAELGERARSAEAALARVTEHCTAEREKIRATYVQTGASPARYLGYADACDDVLATIRAVAAGEQTQGDERG